MMSKHQQKFIKNTQITDLSVSLHKHFYAFLKLYNV